MRFLLGFAFLAGVALATGCSDDDFSTDRPPGDMAGEDLTLVDLNTPDLTGADLIVIDLIVPDLVTFDLAGDLDPGN